MIVRLKQYQIIAGDVLKYIRRHWREYHYSPTVREIMKAVSCSSVYTMLKTLELLKEQGWISYKPKSPRTIVPKFIHEALVALEVDAVVEVSGFLCHMMWLRPLLMRNLDMCPLVDVY